jgi:hypothetical protein
MQRKSWSQSSWQTLLKCGGNDRQKLEQSPELLAGTISVAFDVPRFHRPRVLPDFSENRPIAVKRAPYSIESNVWRADRKMMQTYWYRD